jgi:hypothetical protein
VTYTFMPWAIRWEQQINLKLLGNGFYALHNMDGLLRGDLYSRYQAYAIGRQWGWLSPNDIREKENMNPIEAGDEYLTPMNMVPLGESGIEQTPKDEETKRAIEAIRILRISGRMTDGH